MNDIVWIAATVAAAIVLVAWILRNRITAGKVEISNEKKRVAAELRATAPESNRPAKERSSLSDRSPDVSANVIVGNNLVRVRQNSVRFLRNLVLGKNRIDIGEQSTTRRKANPR